MPDVGSREVYYLVRRKDSDVYERITKAELDMGLSSGTIEARAASGWAVNESGKWVFSANSKEYIRK